MKKYLRVLSIKYVFRYKDYGFRVYKVDYGVYFMVIIYKPVSVHLFADDEYHKAMIINFNRYKESKEKKCYSMLRWSGLDLCSWYDLLYKL